MGIVTRVGQARVFRICRPAAASTEFLRRAVERHAEAIGGRTDTRPISILVKVGGTERKDYYVHKPVPACMVEWKEAVPASVGRVGTRLEQAHDVRPLLGLRIEIRPVHVVREDFCDARKVKRRQSMEFGSGVGLLAVVKELLHALRKQICAHIVQGRVAVVVLCKQILVRYIIVLR